MFTPINFEAVQEMVRRLPRRVQVTGYVSLVHLLSQARRKPGRYNGLDLQRGDVSLVLRDIPDQIPVTFQQFRTILTHFQEACFLTQKLTQPNTVVSICNFDSYVNDLYESNTESNTELTQKQHKSNTAILEVVVNDKCKKIKDIPGTDETVPGEPKKSEEEKQRQKLLTSPHWPFIDRLSTWFNSLPQTTSLSPAGRLAAQKEILDLLVLDMCDSPDCEARLEELVRWATEDENFWKAQVRSLGNLRQRKNKKAPKKWENIESSKQRERIVRVPVREPDFLDELMGDA